MKITDPSLWPAGHGLPLFHKVDGELYCFDMFRLVAGGAIVAELAPLYPDDAALVLDWDHGWVEPRRECWCIDLTDGDGRVTDAHVLCLTPRANGNP